jgi:hypothetical protein
MDDHGIGRSKRSGTVRNGPERSGTERNGSERSEKFGHGNVTVTSRDGHGHVTFSAINERFTVIKCYVKYAKISLIYLYFYFYFYIYIYALLFH